MTSKEEARRRYQEALHLIEEAQLRVGMASGLLSRLTHAGSEHEDASRLYDVIKTVWWRIDQKYKAEMDLDEQTKAKWEGK